MPQVQTLLKTQTRKSRSTILRAAEKLFANQGFQATTLRQISAKSGANGALVSYYFGGKEGLWDAVLEEKLGTLDDILSPTTNKAGKVKLGDLQSLMRGLFAFVRKDQGFHRLALRTLLEDPTLKKRITANLWHPFHDRLTALVKRASEDRLSVEEAQLRAHVLSGLVQKYGNLLCFYFDSAAQKAETDSTLARLEAYTLENLLPEICAIRD